MTELKAQVDQARKSEEEQAEEPPQKTNHAYVQEMQYQSENHSQNTIGLKEYLSSAIIMKDYSKALIGFALSSIALPYLNSIASKHSLLLQRFYLFVNKDAKKVDSFQSLRRKLLIFAIDADDVVKCKRVFREICEVFLNHFSVNWIFNGGMNGKMTYLRYRFKILRRIQRL